MKVGVIGAGAWGTALAQRFTIYSKRHIGILLATNSENVVDEINQFHTNRAYHSNIELSPNIVATLDVNKIADCECYFLVVPVRYIELVLAAVKNPASFNKPLIICSKGIDTKNDGVLLSELVKKHLPYAKIMFLSGPSFANEFIQGLPAALLLSSDQYIKEAKQLIDKMKLTKLKFYFSEDIIGAQVAAAIKNVVAIASGMISGMGLGHNAAAALITRSLSEISILAESYGGKKQTVYGLSGLGDLVLTATSAQSRNFILGAQIGLQIKEKKSLSIASDLGTTEGLYTIQSVYGLCSKRGLDLPICNAMYKIVYEGGNPEDIINRLFDRPNDKEF